MSQNAFFVMLKPDALSRGLVGEILSRFEKRGFIFLKIKMMTPQDKNFNVVLKEHYVEFEKKSFYSTMMDFLQSDPVIILMMIGNIDTAREIVGSTIPSEAQRGTIRGDYASSLPQNLIHCSHTAEAAAREVELWSAVFE